MARTYKTLSLSLPPGVVEELAAIGKPAGRVAARVATQIVLREIAKVPPPREQSRNLSWCCMARVVPIQGRLVLDEDTGGKRSWIPAVVLLCEACRRQMHGREYEGWITDV
jgi:hypothetical protein